MVKQLLQMLGVGVVLLPALAFVLFLVLAFLRRRRLEFRCQLLEVIGLATRHRLPVSSTLEKLAQGLTGRHHDVVRDIAHDLKYGDRMATALEQHAARLFPNETLAAIDAAEGSDRLAPMLAHLAKDDDLAMTTHHRLTMVLIYPAIVAGMLLLVTHFWKEVITPSAVVYGHSIQSWYAPIGALVWSAAILLLMARVFGTGCTVPQRVVQFFEHWSVIRRARRLLLATRLLRGVALLIRSGASWPSAFRLCAPSLDNPHARRQVLAAATLMESGASIDAALAKVPLPGFASSRVAAMAGAQPAQAADRLEVLAAECGSRFQTHTDRWVALVQPVALVLIGVGLAGMFHALMRFHDHYLAEAMPLW